MTSGFTKERDPAASPGSRSEAARADLGLKGACSSGWKRCCGRWVKILILQELSMLKRITSSVSVRRRHRRSSLRRGADHRAGARQRERRHPDQDRVRAASGRRAANRPELANVTPESPELRKAIAEVTPQLILDAVDELLLDPARTRTRPRARRRAVQEHRRQHQEVEQPRQTKSSSRRR